MDTQTLQRLRTELEAASTLHLALGRIAQRASADAPTAWTGPLLEELEDLAGDDGSFSHASLAEIRRRSGAALVAQYHSMMAALEKAPASQKPGLRRLRDAVLVTGTQDASIATNGSIPGALSSLVRSAGLQLEAAMRAAMLARDGLPVAPVDQGAARAPRRRTALPRQPARATTPKSARKPKPRPSGKKSTAGQKRTSPSKQSPGRSATKRGKRARPRPPKKRR